jgi:hypothetical protein
VAPLPDFTGTKITPYLNLESSLPNLTTTTVYSLNMTTKPFGRHPTRGEEFTLTTITSKPHGIIDVSFTNIGATIVSWKIGGLAYKKELVLGFKDGVSYLSSDNPFFGLQYPNRANIQVQRLGESQTEYRKQNSRMSTAKTTN